MTNGHAMRRPAGAVLHSPRWYDALLWLSLRGGERRLRRRILGLAGVKPGESVLDVGCGTGTLAILARQAVGPAGSVRGVDASPEMVARARAKAASAGVDARFENAPAQELPFAQATFDLALGTMMLHHLGRAGRRQLAAELRRVVKPGGRVLIVDFAGPAARSGRLSGHFTHRHGHVDPAEVVSLLADAGFGPVETGAVGVKGLQFARAAVPAPGARGPLVLASGTAGGGDRE